MSSALAPRRRRATTVAIAVLLAPIGLVTLQQSQAQAASIFGQTLTAVAPSKVAALTLNQVVTLTGTNFDESQIASIDLGTCTGLTTYVVASTTSIVVKTPNTCAASAGGTAETVTINEPANAGALTKATALTFVTAPALALLANFPIITENSAALTVPKVVLNPTGASTTGLQRIRVTALAGGYEFDARAASGVTATIGGRALTALTVYNVDGTLQSTTTGPPTGDTGNYFVATLPTALTTASSLTLYVTSLGVTRSFAAAVTGISWWAGPIVTSLDVTSGKAKGGTTVKITGTGFVPDPTPTSPPTKYDGTIADVTFCGITVTAAKVTAATATLITLTTPDASVASPGLGTTVFEGACPVRVSAGANTSPISPGSYFVYLTG
jgi:hypothetical protein